MLFNFRLAPLRDIAPWRSADGPHLHWFGLTDGEYWIEAGDDRLFAYSPGVRERDDFPQFCSYAVSRLYDDLADMTPHILEAVPDPLAAHLRLDGRRELRDAQPWSAVADDLVPAWRWIHDRRLDSAYLSPSANIQVWSDESDVWIEWDNRDRMVDGVAAWAAVQGAYRLPRAGFIAEVRSFHDRLMREMGERVQQVAAGALSEIPIDRPGLLHEQARRSAAIDHIFSAPQPPTDWSAVRRAIGRVLKPKAV